MELDQPPQKLEQTRRVEYAVCELLRYERRVERRAHLGVLVCCLGGDGWVDDWDARDADRGGCGHSVGIGLFTRR